MLDLGKISEIPENESEKAVLIIDNYIEYTYDVKKWIPFNLCLIA